MFKKILVPTDFSEKSGQALAAAVRLAYKSGGEVLLMHVVEIPIAVKRTPEGSYISLKKEAEAFMEEVLSATLGNLHLAINQTKQQTGFDVPVKPLALIGDLHVEIPKQIADEGVDLLVISGKPLLWINEVFESTDRERIIKMAQCPVLALNGPLTDMPIGHIVFATDFKEDLTKISSWIKKVQAVFDARMTLIHVKTPLDFSSDQTHQKQGEEFIKKYGFENTEFKLVKAVKVKSGIQHFASESGAQLIVMVIRNQHFIYRMVQGSTANEIVNESITPTLTLNISKMS